MNNLLDQLSPRLSLSYRLSDPLYINANIGRYYELPPYTTLGFKDNEGNYVNRTNHLSYIRSDQAGLGLEYRPTSYLKFTAEGFYKHYDRYPMSILDSIPLASKGTDYGVLGNEAVSSTATSDPTQTARRAVEVTTMKVKPSVKKICDKCKVIRRHGNVMVICDNPRHKQRQG